MLLSSEVNLFLFVIRFYKSFLSVLDILHVDTRGNINSSNAVQLHSESNTNRMSTKL